MQPCRWHRYLLIASHGIMTSTYMNPAAGAAGQKICADVAASAFSSGRAEATSSAAAAETTASSDPIESEGSAPTGTATATIASSKTTASVACGCDATNAPGS